jgi:hypothetical protein
MQFNKNLISIILKLVYNFIANLYNIKEFILNY